MSALNPLYEVFDETENTLTMSSFDVDTNDAERMLDYVQKEQAVEQEALQDTYQDGFEKGYQQGLADKADEQMNSVNAIIASLQTALADKDALTQTVKQAATAMLSDVIEACLPALIETTFATDVEAVLQEVAQTVTDSTGLTLHIHPEDREVLEAVTQADAFGPYTIVLKDTPDQTRHTLRATWDSDDSGGAVFDPTRAVLDVVKDL